jgi:uncharacterized membrane protein YgcG
MTANELADLLDEIPVGDFESLDHHHFTRQAATMLRQQQAEIAALKLRELTDEEIEEAAKPYCDLQNWVVDKHEFARAILKKASEK